MVAEDRDSAHRETGKQTEENENETRLHVPGYFHKRILHPLRLQKKKTACTPVRFQKSFRLH